MKKRFGFNDIRLLMISLLILSALTFTCDNEYFILYRDWRQVFTPEFKPMSGRYENQIMVEIKCKSRDSIIYYSLNGEDPTEESQVYQDPIQILPTETPVIIRAMAVKKGLVNSEIGEASYEVFIRDPDQPIVEDPVLNPASGTYSTDTQVEISCETSEASIYYTVDGSDPTNNSQLYESPIPLSSYPDGVTIRVIAALEGANIVYSNIVEASYAILRVPSPEIYPETTTFNDDYEVTLSCANTEAQIYYTTDGETPSQSIGVLYSGPFTLSQNAQVQAVAYQDGWIASIIVSREYSIQVADPVFDPPSSTHDPHTLLEIAITSQTMNALIRYTSNGTNPTTTYGTLYTTSFYRSRCWVLKAIAYREGCTPSNVVTVSYVIPEDIQIFTGTVAFLSLDTDSYDHPHASYYLQSSRDLNYTKYDGSSWFLETVDDTASDVGTHNAMCLNLDDEPQIAYQRDVTNSYFWYAKKPTSGGWNRLCVLGGAEVMYNSVVVDSQNNIHGSNYNRNGYNLCYFFTDGVTYNYNNITTDGDVGMYSSIDVDSLDNPHVSFYDNTQNRLRYTYWDSSWIFIDVPGGENGEECDIVLDSNDHVYISYIDYHLGNDNLVCADYNPTTAQWNETVVDSPGTVGLGNCIGIDSQNHVHISYEDYDNADLKYANNIGGVWKTYTLDNDGVIGMDTSCAVDSRDYFHIIYTENTDYALRYLYLDPYAFE